MTEYSSIDANRQYHDKDVLGLTKYAVRRASSTALRKKISEDFSHAREMCATREDRPLIALDCLTGDGEWIAEYFKAGFDHVFAVDLSPDEISKIKEHASSGDVTPIVAEICSYFDANPEKFDFIYFNSLHHIQDYVSAVKKAVSALRVGGLLYLTENKLPAGLYGKLLIKFDDHLFALMADPRRWLKRVSARLGLNFDGENRRAWQLARQAEVHAGIGLDFEAIRETLENAGCRVRFEDLAMYPQSVPIAYWGRKLDFPRTVHLCVERTT